MFGIFSKTTDSSIVEAAGIAGLDFIILDQEHGLADRQTLSHHIRAANLTKMLPIVRVAELNHNLIGSAYDVGAAGVQVPNISNLEQAKLAIEAARFQPIGMRGVCRFVKAAKFGELEKNSYFDSENNKILILQVEGKEGIQNIDQILQLDGFDVIFIGPYDLSQSLGFLGDIDHPEVVSQFSILAEKAKKCGKKIGAFADTESQVKRLRSYGFDFIAYSVDINIFAKACINLLKI